jgi:hypothetical protein
MAQFSKRDVVWGNYIFHAARNQLFEKIDRMNWCRAGKGVSSRRCETKPGHLPTYHMVPTADHAAAGPWRRAERAEMLFCHSAATVSEGSRRAAAVQSYSSPQESILLLEAEAGNRVVS